MSKIKVVGLALAAILAMSAITAGAASAASRVWVVKGATLGAGATRTMTAKTVAGKSWELKASSITITCTTMSITGGSAIGGAVGTDKGTVEFTGCSSNCGTKAVAEPIKTAGNETELVENTAKTKVLDLFKPNASKEFATVLATGCFPEETKVEGENGVAAEISQEGTEQLIHVMKFPCPPITEALNSAGTKLTLSLKAFGFVAAEFCGEAEAELLNGLVKENWSVK
jgi:hypothetical protein